MKALIVSIIALLIAFSCFVSYNQHRARKAQEKEDWNRAIELTVDWIIEDLERIGMVVVTTNDTVVLPKGEFTLTIKGEFPNIWLLMAEEE